MGSRIKRREFIDIYKEAHPCIDCGNNDIRVLQFDHRDPSTKIATVNSSVNVIEL